MNPTNQTPKSYGVDFIKGSVLKITPIDKETIRVECDKVDINRTRVFLTGKLSLWSDGWKIDYVYGARVPKTEAEKQAPKQKKIPEKTLEKLKGRILAAVVPWVRENPNLMSLAAHAALLREIEQTENDIAVCRVRIDELSLTLERLKIQEMKASREASEIIR